MSEMTQYEKDQLRRARFLDEIRDDAVLSHCTKAQRYRLVEFALQTGVPIVTIRYLVLGIGELQLTDNPQLGKYHLALMFGGRWVKEDDDDLPF